MEKVPYRKVLDSAIYLWARTRPVISTAMIVLEKLQVESLRVIVR